MQKRTALGYTAFDLAAQHTNLATVKMLLEDSTNAWSTNHSLNNEDHMPTKGGYGQADIKLLRGSLRWSQCVWGRLCCMLVLGSVWVWWCSLISVYCICVGICLLGQQIGNGGMAMLGCLAEWTHHYNHLLAEPG